MLPCLDFTEISIIFIILIILYITYNQVHVAQDANINNVVVNKPANTHKIRDCWFFYYYNIYVILGMTFVLDTF